MKCILCKMIVKILHIFLRLLLFLILAFLKAIDHQDWIIYSVYKRKLNLEVKTGLITK